VITTAWVRMMAGYNAEMNRRLYEAAGGLDDLERRRDRGAFFGSIHATLNHLLWADRAWMARFADGEWPGSLQDGLGLHDAFPALEAARIAADAGLLAWAEELDPIWLHGDTTWFSSTVGQEVTHPRGLLVTHLFNHQTHHRGQVHAMLTAAGAQTRETDLWRVVQP
jgi:uncharacterized damage-inducible protein DinB